MKKKYSLITGSIIILLIISTPYFLYFYKTVPNVENWETFIGMIKGGAYDNAQIIVYYFLTKLVPLILLFIWFITCKHWWVHSIIIPISVYLFQLISVINDSEEFMDEVEFIYTLPITIGVVLILYFLRSKLSLYIQAMDLKKEMDTTIKTKF